MTPRQSRSGDSFHRVLRGSRHQIKNFQTADGRASALVRQRASIGGFPHERLPKGEPKKVATGEAALQEGFLL